MKVTVIGAGYVGLSTGLVLASLGNKVYFVDVDKEKLESLKEGKPPFYEPHVEDLLKRTLKEKRVIFTTDYSEAIPLSDVVFICVGTPLRVSGEADTRQVMSAVRDISKHLGGKTVSIVIKSTVPVGTAREVEKQINKDHYGNFIVLSNPEFLREGHAIEDTFKPDRIVIGANDKKAIEHLIKLYDPIIKQTFKRVISDRLDREIPVVVTTNESAELIKYAANAFLATKISFINEIANIAENVGADITDVAFGIGLDPRIGNLFLKAGLGWGGSCFPKDLKALHQMVGNSGYLPGLLKAVIKVNDEQRFRFLQKIVKVFGDGLRNKKIAVLGIAFKAGTDDLRNSPGVEIVKQLVSLGAKISIYDPLALENARKTLPESVGLCDSIEKAVEKTDAIIITTEAQEFKTMNLEKLGKLVREKIIFDGRNIISNPKGWDYWGVGR